MDFFIFASEQWLLVSILLGFVYLLAWRESSKGGQALSYHELTQLVNRDTGVVLDIRDKKDFSSGHITGAINIPLASLPGRIGELEPMRSKKIILVCKFGQTAGAAGKQLAAAGFDIAKLKGGMAEWQSNSLPVVKTN